VALAPCANLGAVLEQEDQAERGQGKEEDKRRQLFQPARHAVQQGADRPARRRAGVGLGALDLARIDAEVLEPARDRVLRVRQVGAEITALARDPSDHHHHHTNRERNEPDQQQHRAGQARHPVPLSPADERSRDRRYHGRGDQRCHDRLGE
jgi:hypothetical protein